MNAAELSIIIPAKNEAVNVRKVLRSIAMQDYLQTHKVQIILADADSTDGTTTLAYMATLEFGLTLMVIGGGLPAKGRNNGARCAAGRYLLFMDADVELEDSSLLTAAVGEMRAKALHCLTTDVHVTDPMYFWSKYAYHFTNVCQRCSRFLGVPFATGMFMLFDREAFSRLGGFREDAMFGEDYMLSKLVGWKRFRVIPGGVKTSVRRMRMGFWR